MSEHPAQAYLLLEFLATSIANRKHPLSQRDIPESLQPWLVYCEGKELIGYVPWVVPTAKGRPALFMRGREPVEDPVTPRRNEQGTPRILLTGWHDITAALDMKYGDRANIKSLNKRFDGPITNKGKGTKPMVYRDELFQWWDGLATKQQELTNQQQGRRLMAEAQHNYGRSGTVAPEIGGSVKKRRKRPDQT